MIWEEMTVCTISDCRSLQRWRVYKRNICKLGRSHM